jgi:hypothetical protein
VHAALPTRRSLTARLAFQAVESRESYMKLSSRRRAPWVGLRVLAGPRRTPSLTVLLTTPSAESIQVGSLRNQSSYIITCIIICSLTSCRVVHVSTAFAPTDCTRRCCAPVGCRLWTDSSPPLTQPPM